jgi:hypothetical protein
MRLLFGMCCQPLALRKAALHGVVRSSASRWQRAPHPSRNLTADHRLPVAAGGHESGPLDVLCRSCNGRKQAVT